MEYRKFGDTYVVRMDRGEEIISCLAGLCRKEDIRMASVDALGEVDHAAVTVYDVPARVFHNREFNEPMEIGSLCGNVTRRDGEVYIHLHVTLCDVNAAVHGGHAKELHCSATCEMFVRTLPGEVGRRFDEETGLNLFRF